MTQSNKQNELCKKVIAEIDGKFWCIFDVSLPLVKNRDLINKLL